MVASASRKRAESAVASLGVGFRLLRNDVHVDGGGFA